MLSDATVSIFYLFSILFSDLAVLSFVSGHCISIAVCMHGCVRMPAMRAYLYQVVDWLMTVEPPVVSISKQFSNQTAWRIVKNIRRVFCSYNYSSCERGLSTKNVSTFWLYAYLTLENRLIHFYLRPFSMSSMTGHVHVRYGWVNVLSMIGVCRFVSFL